MKRLFVFLAVLGWWSGGFAESGLTAPDAPDVFEFRTPHALSCRIDRAETTAAAGGGTGEWLPARAGKSTNVVEFGSRVVVQLEPDGTLEGLMTTGLLKLSRNPAPNVFILQAPDAWTAVREAHRLAALPQVRASYPVLRRQSDLNGLYAPQPTDYFFNIQWPLEHRMTDGVSAGPDLNVRAAWPFSTGKGVTIAVADAGVELTHPELAPRAAGAPHHNFANGSTNGSPINRGGAAAHGTHVAGLAVAQTNSHRMAGVAPGAGLASWVIYTTNFVLVSDEELMDMYQFQPDLVGVQNHSWSHNGVNLNGLTLLEEIGVSNAVHHGRGGRGVIMVRSAGNDRMLGANANDDGYPSDPRVIAVAAMRRDGRAANYSEPGASLLVSGPANDSTQPFQLFTTDLLGTDGRNTLNYFPPFQDLNGYIFDALGFSGTSAAVPHISGLAALMLSVNTNLTYRDVQQILILSSRHYDFADPDLSPNGAGFLVSHNVGFGLPDAGQAVQLARSWSNRPPLTNVILTSTTAQAIPDDGLRLLITGTDIPGHLASIRTLPGTGPHADVPTAALPLVDVGLATNTITTNLANKAALIERGTNTFEAKINFAARAGAWFAVIYNFATNTSGSGAPGGDQLMPLAGTDYTPIPAVFISHTNGVALRGLFQTNNSARAQIRLTSTNYTFAVSNSLLCEHVGVRVRTDHPLRGDVRITLVSPSGKRSVLQRYNADETPGPADWTYYSTQHFYESSRGNWTVYFSDEFLDNTGTVQQVSLIIRGTQIQDTDGDGLHDPWETMHFGKLVMGPEHDPDWDGYSNMREQIMATDPTTMNVPLKLDLSRWTTNTLARLSWPASANFTYRVFGGTNLSERTVLTNLPGKFPEVEWFTRFNTLRRQFFHVEAVPIPP
jgi:subtilisin family serine protease/subtilisin-like proprotein convertase family protein